MVNLLYFEGKYFRGYNLCPTLHLKSTTKLGFVIHENFCKFTNPRKFQQASLHILVHDSSELRKLLSSSRSKSVDPAQDL